MNRQLRLCDGKIKTAYWSLVGVVSDMMDAVSGLFLQALGTDMTAMEESFPFVSKAFQILTEAQMRG